MVIFKFKHEQFKSSRYINDMLWVLISQTIHAHVQVLAGSLTFKSADV